MERKILESETAARFSFHKSLLGYMTLGKPQEHIDMKPLENSCRKICVQYIVRNTSNFVEEESFLVEEGEHITEYELE